MDFSNKVILITGAGSGIGAATAIQFSKLGAKLSLTDKDKGKLDEVASKCADISKIDPITHVGDLTNEEDVKFLVNNTIKYFLTIDVLVNNAGILQLGSIFNATLVQYDAIFKLNVRSVFYITSLVVPYLIKSKGSIVNVSSTASSRTFEGFLLYNMSKAAVDQLTNTLALELASKSVRVNSVNPGVVSTSLLESSGIDEAAYASFFQQAKQLTALGRVAQPEEIASAITYLASDKASFITGVNLFVDGGLHLHSA